MQVSRKTQALVMICTFAWLTCGSAFGAHAAATGTRLSHEFTSIDGWSDEEAAFSFSRMRANISPAGMLTGMVVASPSQRDPDYFFYWVRDAALVMDVVQRAGTGAISPDDRRRMMDDYIDLSARLQRSNPMHGLGEAKFNPDGSPYTAWNSPQNDGPALRALTLIHYAQELLAQGRVDEVRARLYDNPLPTMTVIKTDLEFVAHHWGDPCFDLWEEVMGTHFYTRIVQLSALRQGAVLANQMGDGGASNFYNSQADAIQADLPQFWDSGNFIRVTRDVLGDNRGKNSGLDSAVILGVLHANLSRDGANADVGFGILDARVMATAERLEKSFYSLYPINSSNQPGDLGTAVGRYPEDVYSGRDGIPYGNPWVLATAALAEYNYRAAAELTLSQKPFRINGTNLRFIHRVTGGQLAGHSILDGTVLRPGSSEMHELASKLRGLGDLYLKRVQQHANPDGTLSEQMDRYSGYMTSANNLSWSYASFITAYWARLRSN